MSERPRVLDQLGHELDRVARHNLAASGGVRLAPRRLSVVVVLLALLVVAAAATAAVLLIQQGPPLPPPHAQDLRSSGVPLPGSARLAGLDAPDPNDSNPPWDLRLSRTRTGETCTAVGQVVGGRFGIVGLDHVFRALPLGSVDSCGIDTPGRPTLVGVHDFAGSSASQERTVLSGVAGSGARSVTAYVGNAAPRRLELGPHGSFIAAYAGTAEQLRPRVVVVNRDGHVHTVALEQSSAFEVPDPHGGSGWAASTEADIESNAFPDEDCVQVTREPSQSEASQVTLPLTPEVCGRLAANPLVVQMRRFVPGEDATPFPWGNAPSRTIVYGIATPRIASLTLSGAGPSRALGVDPHGRAFLAVLDGHVDPRALTLTAALRDGSKRTYTSASGLLAYRTNRPLTATPVPPYRSPAPAKATQLPPFEIPIPSTQQENLRAADPAGGPTWVVRSWQGQPNPKVRGVGHERFICVELGLLVGGKLVEPGSNAARTRHPLTSEQGRCNSASSLARMRYMLLFESFLDDPYEYTPHPTRAVLSGVLPPGASHALLLGVGAARPLRLDSNNAFLAVVGGRYWSASPRITFMLHGHRVGKLTHGALFPLGTAPQVPQVRAPDPDGGAPWGFASTVNCSTAVGRIVDGRFASIDLTDGVLKSGPEQTGWRSSCSTHPEAFTPLRLRHEPVEFDEQQADAAAPLFGRSAELLSPPEIERRTLPGRTVITGIAHADVLSVTLSTPSDVRTLRPSGPRHAILAVYDGYFLRGHITATVRLRDGRVATEQVSGPGRGAYEPPSLATRLRESERMLAQARAREHDRKSQAHTPRGLVVQIEAPLRVIQRHLAYMRSHPGVMPPE
ncbi:MAG: hypothetical protein ACYDHN_00690 [Solirubrobacteraceae bacterium]